MAVIKIVPFPGPKGDKGDQGDPGQGGGNNLGLIKTGNWNYPSPNGVAIQPSENGESIALKSSQSAAVRWHIRDGGPSVANYSATILSINNSLTDGNIVTFDIDEQEAPLPVGYHYGINLETGDTNYNGSYVSTASTTTTLTLDYVDSTDSFDRTNVTGSIYLPSVYSQVEARENGVWVKNANWSEPDGYANYWHFKNDGSIGFPNQSSNARTGQGEVLRFGNTGNQAIITGPVADDGNNGTAQRLVIAGQDGYTGTTGEGGDIYLWAGRGGDAGGTGGDIKVDAGNGQGAGEGGTVKVRGGYSSDGNGGFVEVYSGNSNTGYGGRLSLSAGSSNSGPAGDVGIYGGQSYGANGGNVSISGGFSYASGYVGGSINLTAPMQGEIILNGDGGEFLGYADPSNQIAKISDIPAPPVKSYASFYDMNTFGPYASNSEQAFPMETTDFANGIHIGGINSSEIVIENAGKYNIAFSTQFHVTSASAIVYVWLKKNGISIPNTNTRIDIPSAAPYHVAAWNFFVDAAANDSYEIFWSTPSNNVSIQSITGLTGTKPDVPSVIVTVNQID